MPFTVIIPARLASTRLPDKPLADLGGKPMVVRVAERAALSGAAQIIVATDHPDIAAACRLHGVAVQMTRADHPSGTDRIAEVAAAIGLAADAVVVNVQGDEPLIDPALVAATAAQIKQGVPMATAAHAIDNMADVLNPNVVKVVLDARQTALYFSRSPIPAARDFAGKAWWEDGEKGSKLPKPLRHVGIYGYRVGFLRQFPTLPQAPLEQLESLEQLRALWHGHRIAVHITDEAPGPGVDTPEDLARARKLFS